MTDYKIPFDYQGNLMDYPQNRYAHLPDHPDASPQGYVTFEPEWRDNTPFLATLTLEGMERGRSAAKFIWRDEQARKYPMFMSDMLHLIQHVALDRGIAWDLWWIGKKKGQNYGIALQA